MNSVHSGRIATSEKDTVILSRHGLTAGQVSGEICDTIKKAEEIYAQTFNHIVILDGRIQVTLPWNRNKSSYHCQFCRHKTTSSGYFQIKNIATRAKFTLDDHSLHQLKEHSYFGTDKRRINPIAASRVLGLREGPVISGE